MKKSARNRAQENGTGLRRYVAVLCIFLILLVGGAQLLHSHPTADAADAGCSLCAVAHLAADASPVVLGLVVSAAVHPLHAPAEVLFHGRQVSTVHRIRPPPTLIPSA